MKGEVKEIINCRIDRGKRYFEVLWKTSWEEEEYIRSIADGLVDEFLKCCGEGVEDIHSGDLSQTTYHHGSAVDENIEDALQIDEDISVDEAGNDESYFGEEARNVSYSAGESRNVSYAGEVAANIAETAKPRKGKRSGGINSIISRLQKSQQEGLLKQFDDEPGEKESSHGEEDLIGNDMEHTHQMEHARSLSPNSTNRPNASHPENPHCQSIVLERPHEWRELELENSDRDPRITQTQTSQSQEVQNNVSNFHEKGMYSSVGPRSALSTPEQGILQSHSERSPPYSDSATSEGEQTDHTRKVSASPKDKITLQNVNKYNADNMPKVFPGNKDDLHELGSLEQLQPERAYVEGASHSPQHMNVHRPGGAMLKCQICSDLFYEESKFKQHMFMHEQVSLLRQETPKLLKPGTFECKFCHVLFTDKDKLKMHYTDEHEKEFVHTQPMDQLYQCSLCEQTFVDYNKLIHHHQTHQQQGRREVFILPKEPPAKNAPYAPGSRENPPTNSPVLVHHRASPKSQDQIRNPNVTPALENHRPISNSSSENLEKFDDVFEDEAEGIEPETGEMILKTSVHEDNEEMIATEFSDKKMYRCNLCDELFENENDRARHSLVHVNRSSSLDCHICGKQFRHRTNLSTHLIVHSGVKPHQCHICLRRFTQKVNLQRHMHIHDGSRPFTCRMCSKSFTQKANLQRHILSHTEHTKEELLTALNEIPNESEVNNAINESLTEAMSIVMEQKQEPIGEIEEPKSEHRCEICDKTFAQKINLQKHMLIHNGARPFQCYICGKAFRQRATLQKHYAVHTNGSSSFICQTCNRLFVSRTNLQRHMLVHALPGQNQCYLCDQKFSTTDNLERHFSEHIEESSPDMSLPQKYFDQSAPGQTFRCATCEIVFDSPIVFSQHLQCHQNVFPPEAAPKDMMEMSRVHNPAPQHIQINCNTCGASFMSFDALEEHAMIHHNADHAIRTDNNKYPPDNIRNIATSSAHIEHQEYPPPWNPPPTAQMPTPPRMATPHPPSDSEIAVKREVVTPPPSSSSSSTPQTPRVSRCPVCKEMFPSKKEMREHYSIAHLETPVIENPSHSNDRANEFGGEHPINYTSPSNTEVANMPMEEVIPEEDISVDETRLEENPDNAFHVAVISESEERLIKENEEFIKDNILGGPAEYESKGRYERGNYSCKICNRVLTYKYSLEKHMLLHTGSFPYKCHLCSKRFNHKANYDKHLIVHRGEKPYSCHICARPFSQKSNLQRHQLTHTQNRDFICDVCGKRFNHMASLKTHSLIHTGAKPFSCYICTKRFNQKGNLKRHIQTHRTGKRNKISGLENDPDIDSIIKNEMESMVTTERVVETMVKPEENTRPDAYSYIPNESATMLTMQDDSFYARAAKVHHELTQLERNEMQRNDMREMKMEKEQNTPTRRSNRPRHKKNMDDYEFLDYDEPLPTMIGGEEFQKASNSQAAEPQVQRLHENEVMPYPAGYEGGEQILTVLPSDAMYGEEMERKPFGEVKYEMEERKETFHCGQCSKLFISQASLEAHKKHAHSFIMCDICGRPFSQKANLLKHKLIHANKKPFACRVCNKAFRQKANLQRHELIHDKDRKTVNCAECNKSFRCAWSLKQHMKNHNAGGAFGCSICGKTFKGKDRLMHHFSVHNQLGVFTCHICGIKFPSPEHLLKHLETHGSFPVPSDEGGPAVDVMTVEHGNMTWVSPSGSGDNLVVVANPSDDRQVMNEFNKDESTVAISSVEMTNGPEIIPVQTYNGNERFVHLPNAHNKTVIFQCNLCEMQFQKHDHLLDHMQTHENFNVSNEQHRNEATIVSPSIGGDNLVVVTTPAEVHHLSAPTDVHHLTSPTDVHHLTTDVHHLTTHTDVHHHAMHEFNRDNPRVTIVTNE